MPDETNNIIPEFTFEEDDFPTTTAEQTPEPATQEPPEQQEETSPPPPPVGEEATPDPESGDGPEGEDSGIDDRYLDLWRFYRNEGLHTLPVDRDPKTNEEFLNAMAHQRIAERDMIRQQLVEQAPEFGRSIVDYIFRKGDDLTEEDLQEFISTSAQYKAISPENIKGDEDARAYLHRVYEQRGESPDDIPDMLDLLQDKGKLVAKAKQYAEEEAKAYENWEQEQLQAIEQQKAESQKMVQELDTHVRSFLEQQEWANERKAQVYDQIFSQRLREITQNIVYYPAALTQLSNYLLNFDPERGIIDEEMWKKQAFSPKVSRVKERLESSFLSSGAGISSAPDRKKRKSGNNESFEFA